MWAYLTTPLPAFYADALYYNIIFLHSDLYRPVSSKPYSVGTYRRIIDAHGKCLFSVIDIFFIYRCFP